MNQFFISDKDMAGDSIIITGPDVNHIRNVLKLRNGEELSLVNTSNSMTYYCTIESSDKDSVKCLIQDVQNTSTELPVMITLYQGLPKGDKLEFVIQKAVEMGATRVVPVSMKRSVMKIDPKKSEAKHKRWQAIAESAASQSKRGRIPEVGNVISFKEALAETTGDGLYHADVILLPYELASGMDGSRQVMEDIKKRVDSHEGDMPLHIAIFIGPEGGFDQSEIDAAALAGASVITLGRRILRTETAPLAILAWLTYMLDK